MQADGLIVIGISNATAGIMKEENVAGLCGLGN